MNTPLSDYELVRRLVAPDPAIRDDPRAMLTASVDAVIKFHQHLEQLIGPEGTYAVFMRALESARVTHPVLAEITIRPRETPTSAALAVSDFAREGGVTAEALLALLASATGLLTRLIGGDMVDRFVHQAWSTRTLNGQRAGLRTNEARIPDGE